MTPERAIEIIKDNILFTSGVLEEAFDVIEQAFEKQIPKKPLIIKHDKDIKFGYATWKAGVPIYKCSRCNGFISRSNKFCTDCGQALDWSDEK